MAPNSTVSPSSAHLQRKRKYLSDDGDFSDDDSGFSPKSASLSADDDRRAHHNELERRRRDHIKDHFSNLKNAIPLLEGEKSSRALILKRAVDYIQVLQAQLKESKMEIEDQKRQNEQLRHHATMGLMSQSALTAPPPAPQPQPPLFTLPSTTSSAFSCLPTTSVQPSAFTSIVPTGVPEGRLPSSPLVGATGATTNFASGFPSMNVAANDQAKTTTALLSSLLLQNFGQLMQVPAASGASNPTGAIPHPPNVGGNDFNNCHQFFAFNDCQLAVGQL